MVLSIYRFNLIIRSYSSFKNTSMSSTKLVFKQFTLFSKHRLWQETHPKMGPSFTDLNQGSSSFFCHNIVVSWISFVLYWSGFSSNCLDLYFLCSSLFLALSSSFFSLLLDSLNCFIFSLICSFSLYKSSLDSLNVFIPRFACWFRNFCCHCCRKITGKAVFKWFINFIIYVVHTTYAFWQGKYLLEWIFMLTKGFKQDKHLIVCLVHFLDDTFLRVELCCW